jgi:hypothetical protein
MPTARCWWWSPTRSSAWGCSSRRASTTPTSSWRKASRWGLGLNFGGPYLGIFASREKFVRKMPGRLVGETTDTEGKRGYVLTFSTREQHIRRDKATSNICTNQGLIALMAAMYLAYMGKSGLRDVADLCYHKAHYAAAEIGKLPGYKVLNQGAFFNEFVVECPRPVKEINTALLERGILGGYDLGLDYPDGRQPDVGVRHRNEYSPADRTAGSSPAGGGVMWLRDEPLIFELSSPGRTAYTLPELDVPAAELPDGYVRDDLNLPEVSEMDVVRHFTRLSQKNYSIDTVFYPLGSCTMKYNPKVNEGARDPRLRRRTRYQPEATSRAPGADVRAAGDAEGDRRLCRGLVCSRRRARRAS